jgi:phosphate:Na+ symporter
VQVLNRFKHSKLVGIFAVIFLISVNTWANEVQISQSRDVKEYIENLHSDVDGTAAEVSWNIKYDKVPLNGKLIVRYIKKNLTKINDNPNWNYTDYISADKTTAKLANLPTNESMSFCVGVQFEGETKKQIHWSKAKSFKTDRGWELRSGLIMRILMLLGSLAMFIYGMKIMSEGIQKAAGHKLRQILGSMTSNRIKGIFTGFLTTSIIQSSSATTVMVVSFVNAGLLNLKESIGVIMGANIGTTVTAWLVAYLGFSVSMSDYALPIFLVALLLLFSSNHKLKSWGEMLAGFALLFIGLEMLKSGVPDVKGSVDTLSFLSSVTDYGTLSVIIAVIIGTLVTVLVQSSSAAMAVTILLCERGIIPFEMAAGMVLGENIGTTITANIAAIVGNVHAKRAARAHFIFNVFGVVWMVIVFPFYIDMIDDVSVYLGYNSPIDDQSARPIALALFHTIFNLLNVLFLIGFTNLIASTVVKMVPSRNEGDEDFKLEYIASGVMSTPELSLLEAKKEIGKFGHITAKMSNMFKDLLFEKEKKKKKKIIDRIEKYEIITDTLREEIMAYLSRCAEDELSKESQMKVRAYIAINNDLERIGDIYYQMSLVYKKKEEEKIWFSPEQRNNINKMLLIVDEAFATMKFNLDAPEAKVDLEKAYGNEKGINDLRDLLRDENDELLDSEDFNVKSNVIYSDMIFSCERIGDLIINVSKELKYKL